MTIRRILTSSFLLFAAAWSEQSACDQNQEYPSCDPVEQPQLYDGDFTRVPLSELTIEPITWSETGELVTDWAFEVRVPDTLITALLEYSDRLGITERFRELTVGNKALAPGTQEFIQVGDSETSMEWYIQRPESHWKSNMHWISPADDASQDDFLRVLGDGGMDTVLKTIGQALGLDGLVCYQLTFIGVSQCEQGYIHYDFTDVDARAYNVIIPLIITPNSPPELLLQSPGYPYYRGGYNYRLGAATVIGEDAMHGTGEVQYKNEFRMAATIYIADVNDENMDRILAAYTQYYPPKDPEKLLSQAGIHWGKGQLPRGASVKLSQKTASQ